MEKEFIPYEQALELKELGFDEPCFALYSAMEGENHKFLWATSSLDHVIEGQKKGHKFFNDSKGDKTRIQHFIKNSYAENTVTAPLYQQAFRWFREKHGLHYNMQVLDGKWFFERWSLDGFKTYEESELACLKKLIELVKEK